MNKEELKNRTKKFHISVIKACEVLPKNAAGFELAKQLIQQVPLEQITGQPAEQNQQQILFIKLK